MITSIRAAYRFHRHRLLPRRGFSTLQSNPIELSYNIVKTSAHDSTNHPVIILHGLFGMKRNWLSLSKAFARDLKRPVYTLDLRNHGESPHAKPMTYDAMAADVLHFCAKHSLSDVSLIGHSMGGKVAMAVALSSALRPGLLRDLVVVDIAPVRAKLSAEFQGYIRAMREIEEANVSTRSEAQEILKPYEPDPMTRAFLLTNLDMRAHPLKFRIPLNIIGPAIEQLGWFPAAIHERTWDGRTLFIKGTKSRYINRRNISTLGEFFRRMQLKELDTGHWVHAERPHEFTKIVRDFLQS